VTRGLLSAGHVVTAVDNSPAMLRRVEALLPMVETVCANIETLRLRRRFDAVTLMSNLINDRSETRVARLRCCARHVRARGVVVIERLDPRWGDADWVATARREASRAGVTTWMTDVTVKARQLSATMHYRVGEREYLHSFVCDVIDDARLDADLGAAGLKRAEWPDIDHERDREWVLAVRAGPTRAGAVRS
jgi:trans-aconitate methyltransferase